MPICAASLGQFIIKIRNNLYTDCQLQDHSILFGHVSDSSQIPEVIPAFQTESFIMRSGPRYRVGRDDKSILLTYTCGVDQSIMLYTTNYHVMNEKTFNENNMHASFKIKSLYTLPTEILWSLEY